MSLKLTFLGGAGTVTGSKYLLERDFAYEGKGSSGVTLVNTNSLFVFRIHGRLPCDEISVYGSAFRPPRRNLGVRQRTALQAHKVNLSKSR